MPNKNSKKSTKRTSQNKNVKTKNIIKSSTTITVIFILSFSHSIF